MESPRGDAIAFVVGLGVVVAAVIFVIVVARPSRAEAITARPCPPIHYVVNPDGAAAEALATIHEAFRRVSDISGIRFVYGGQSTIRAAKSWVATGQPLVLVAWARGADLVEWADDPRVVGSTIARRDSRGAVLTGSVLLNADKELPFGFADRRSWGGVLMHELAHLVGLSHTPDWTEMMYPEVIAGTADWGPADRQQLQWAGWRVGCEPNTSSR